jgi:hypothetical protein
MKKLSCILGKHDYALDIKFTVPVTNDDRTVVIFYAPVAYGMVCVDCKKRKLKMSTNPYGQMATGIIEDAEMWLETGVIDAAAPQTPEIPEGDFRLSDVTLSGGEWSEAYEHIELPPCGGPRLVVDNDG